MRLSVLSLTAAICLIATTPVPADDPVDHFEGEPAETLEQALANFSEYNRRLSDILAQEELSAQDLGRIHELTYTLENALEKINQEMSALAEVLEELHIASETAQYERALENGQDYLETAAKIVD